MVVPCYNEQEVIRLTHERLSTALRRITRDFEILFVDDGSRDATASILAEIHHADERVRVIRLSRNFGHQIAVSAGLESASGNAVVVIDADLQDPPETIAALVAKWREGYDVVYAQRTERPGETHFKRWTASAFYRFINRLSEVSIPLDTGDFRLMDRRVVAAMKAMPERHRLLRAMTSWVGFRQASVPYERAERAAGETKYPLRKMFALAMDGITSFSVIPLRLVTFAGLIFSGLSVAAIGYALVLRLLTDNWVPGWTLSFIATMLIAGLNFLFLGVMGEYIGRIYSEVKGRPMFLVMERLGFDKPVASRNPVADQITMIAERVHAA